MFEIRPTLLANVLVGSLSGSFETDGDADYARILSSHLLLPNSIVTGLEALPAKATRQARTFFLSVKRKSSTKWIIIIEILRIAKSSGLMNQKNHLRIMGDLVW